MPHAAAPTLAGSQIRWIGALLLLAQLPMWSHLPPWVMIVGTALVVVRIFIEVKRKPTWWLLPLLALVAALAIRWQYGYFAARDPCVAFLYLLLGVKFIEARNIRDGGSELGTHARQG